MGHEAMKMSLGSRALFVGRSSVLAGRGLNEWSGFSVFKYEVMLSAVIRLQWMREIGREVRGGSLGSRAVFVGRGTCSPVAD